ncbi:MAG: phage terminase large subunit [Candidatus Schekmanbacteria bacterium]|nr:phage terminase large subunit [Candidatus Schekmanbacteria bacterium]
MKKFTLREFDRRVQRLLAQTAQRAGAFSADSDEAKRQRKERAKEDKFYFFENYLPHYFNLPAAGFHQELVQLLDDKADKNRPAAVAAPREHAKSTIVTLGYPLHQICFGLRHFIIIVSDTEYQAADFVRFIRLELEENERIRQDFGDLRQSAKQWSDELFITKNGVKVLARGKGQKVRGLRHRQYRPDLVVMDDIENDQSVRHPRQIEKVLKWIVEAVYPAIDQHGSLFVIGTLLAKKSVLAQLLQQAAKGVWRGRIYRALDENNLPLWPQRHSLESLQQKKAVMGSVSFNKEYQNDPRDEEGIFREDWLRYYHPQELSGRQLAVFMFIDPSAGSGESADYKAVVTIGRDNEGIIYVLDAYIKKASIDSLLRVTYNRYRELQPRIIGIESNVFQSLLLREFDSLGKERQQHLPLRGINHHTSKEGRIGRLSAWVERGIIRFQKGQTDQDVLLEQLLYFPSPTVHDDGPDALEGAISLADTAPAVCVGLEADKDWYRSKRSVAQASCL